MSKVRARLADVQCSKLKLDPDDKIIVRLKFLSTKEERKKILRMVEKWARVEVIVIDPSMEIEVNKKDDKRIITG